MSTASTRSVAPVVNRTSIVAKAEDPDMRRKRIAPARLMPQDYTARAATAPAYPGHGGSLRAPKTALHRAMLPPEHRGAAVRTPQRSAAFQESLENPDRLLRREICRDLD